MSEEYPQQQPEVKRMFNVSFGCLRVLATFAIQRTVPDELNLPPPPRFSHGQPVSEYAMARTEDRRDPLYGGPEVHDNSRESYDPRQMLSDSIRDIDTLVDLSKQVPLSEEVVNRAVKNTSGFVNMAIHAGHLDLLNKQLPAWSEFFSADIKRLHSMEQIAREADQDGMLVSRFAYQAASDVRNALERALRIRMQPGASQSTPE